MPLVNRIEASGKNYSFRFISLFVGSAAVCGATTGLRRWRRRRQRILLPPRILDDGRMDDPPDETNCSHDDNENERSEERNPRRGNGKPQEQRLHDNQQMFVDGGRCGEGALEPAVPYVAAKAISHPVLDQCRSISTMTVADLISPVFSPRFEIRSVPRRPQQH